MPLPTHERTRPRHSGLRGLRVALALAVASACGSAPPAPPAAIVIGATLPLTGPDASRADAMKRGYERAIAEANAKGGIRIGEATVPVTLDLRDDGADAATVEARTRDLVDAGAHVVVATPRDVGAVTQANLTEHAGIPLIGNPVDHPGLPGKRMQWMVLVPATSAGAEPRAHEIVRATLAAIAEAGTVDPRALRRVLQSKGSHLELPH